MFPNVVSSRTRRRRSATGLAVAACCALSLGLTAVSIGPASARTDPDATRKSAVDRRITALKGDLDDTSKSLQAAQAALDTTTSQLPAAQAALVTAQAVAATADQHNAEAAAALQVAKANEAKAEAQLKATTNQISAARSRVAGFASQIYQEGGLGQLSVAMSATSPADFADRLSLMGTVMDIQERSIGTLFSAQADQTAQESHVSALRADSSAARVRAQQALAAASSARDLAQSAKAALDALAARQTRQTAALAAQKASEQQQLASMQAESSRLQKVLAERARQARIAAAKASAAAKARAAAAERSARRLSPSGGGFLSAAELGQPITSEYGMRFHPILHYFRMHTGLDFGGACGTPIYAAAAGTVISSGWAGGYGNRIVIDHGLVRGVDLATTYNHMERLVAHVGHVNRGQLIGYEGTTGLSTGCHLHFETMENGSFVNPRKWL